MQPTLSLVLTNFHYLYEIDFTHNCKIPILLVIFCNFEPCVVLFFKGRAVWAPERISAMEQCVRKTFFPICTDPCIVQNITGNTIFPLNLNQNTDLQMLFQSSCLVLYYWHMPQDVLGLQGQHFLVLDYPSCAFFAYPFGNLVAMNNSWWIIVILVRDGNIGL